MQATKTKPKNPFKMHSAQETSNFLSLPKVSPNQHTKATETQCDSFHLFCYAPGCPHNRLEPFFLLSFSAAENLYRKLVSAIKGLKSALGKAQTYFPTFQQHFISRWNKSDQHYAVRLWIARKNNTPDKCGTAKKWKTSYTIFLADCFPDRTLPRSSPPLSRELSTSFHAQSYINSQRKHTFFFLSSSLSLRKHTARRPERSGKSFKQFSGNFWFVEGIFPNNNICNEWKKPIYFFWKKKLHRLSSGGVSVQAYIV